MNKKLLITILTILGLTVIVGSFWYFSKLQKTNTNLTQNNTAKNISNNQKQEQEKNQKQKNNNQNQAIDGELKPKEKIDTSDWNTYRNRKYGFEFKYPKALSLYENYVYMSDGKTVSFIADEDYKQNKLKHILFAIEYSQIVNNNFKKSGRFNDFLNEAVGIKNLNKVKKTKNGLAFYEIEFLGNYNVRAFLFRCNDRILEILLDPYQNTKIFTEKEFYDSVLQNIKCIRKIKQNNSSQ